MRAKLVHRRSTRSCIGTIYEYKCLRLTDERMHRVVGGKDPVKYIPKLNTEGFLSSGIQFQLEKFCNNYTRMNGHSIGLTR